MKLLYKEIDRIINDNIGNSFAESESDKGVSKFDEFGNKSYATFKFNKPIIVTISRLSDTVLNNMISDGLSHMRLVRLLRRELLEVFSISNSMIHNLDIPKPVLCRELGVSRNTMDRWLKSFHERKIIFTEGNDTYSLSPDYTPFNPTNMIGCHEQKMLELIHAGRDWLTVPERQRWIYDRYITRGSGMTINPGGVSFSWEYFLVDAYVIWASVVMFGAGKNKNFNFDINRMIEEAAKHRIEVKREDILKIIRDLCKIGYLKRNKGLRARSCDQMYTYTNKVVFTDKGLEDLLADSN